MTRMLTAMLLLGCVLAGNAQTKPNYLLFTDPDRRFTIQFPRGWRSMFVAGSGQPLFTYVQPDDEAAVIVERFKLRLRLEPEEINDQFAALEVENIEENQPRATSVVARIVRQGGLPVIVIDYSRPGIAGSMRQQVRQYSRPVGQNLYRITCTALASQFSRYENVFATALETLTPTSEP